MMEFLTSPYSLVFLLPLTIWEIAWKGVALWKASRNKHTGWFVAMLILNTLGILPIVYILFFSKVEKKKR